METVGFDGTFAGWKAAARQALAAGLRPEEADWRASDDAQPGLDLGTRTPTFELAHGPPRGKVPREFLATARLVSCHRDPSRWALLYRIVWRLNHGEPHLLAIAVDEDVVRMEQMAKAIGRDVHKMRAFVRFREVKTNGSAWFVAWFEPRHFIVELNAMFFVERFASMQWSILTPDRCAHWDGRELTFSEGTSKAAAPTQDTKEDLWLTYYASIFNPARLKISAMKSEMATSYWKNLPEAVLIDRLIAQAAGRAAAMVSASETERTADEIFVPHMVPPSGSLKSLQEEAAACRACPLWRRATCTVFGEGSDTARIMVIGEQPGDAEDRAGKPFVGPAGQLLMRALAEAGVERAGLYVTNAVKHFKWAPAGKRRLHAKPDSREIAACRPWLVAEVHALQPERMICLGATAAASVMGRPVKILEERGRWLNSAFGIPALVTFHPAALLRQPDQARAAADYLSFVADLRMMLV